MTKVRETVQDMNDNNSTSQLGVNLYLDQKYINLLYQKKVQDRINNQQHPSPDHKFSLMLQQHSSSDSF